VKSGKVLTLEEQYLEVVKACVHYDITWENDQPVPRLITDIGIGDDLSALVAFQYYGQAAHNQLIRAPFSVRNTPRPYVVIWDERLRPIIRVLDGLYLSAYGVPYPSVALRDEEFAKGRKPSQTRQWLNKHMFERHIYGLHHGYSAVVHTMADVSKDKMVDLFAEFSQNDTQSREHFDEIKKMLPQAMMLLEQMLDCRKHYRTIRFDYQPEMIKRFVSNFLSSAGIRPGSGCSYPHGSITVREITTGKKFHQFPYYAALFHEFLRDVYEASDIYDRYEGEKDYYCIIRTKPEFKVKWLADIPDEEIEETLAKLIKTCREFFIPNMLQQFLSKLIMSPKQYLERGEVIRIGQKWKHGEAQRFAKRFHAFSKTHRWFTGDVRKLDKNIRDYLLSLYVASGQRYFMDDDPDTKMFLDKLFILLAERINVKMTNHILGIWTLIKGIMYSGGFETSHGDSWILALIFCFYFVMTAQSHPEVASEIVGAIFVNSLVIGAYGDDHLLCVPLSLTSYINEIGFASFVLKYFGMVIREIEELAKFFSEVDTAGELSYKGVVFLKRYFILVKPKTPEYPIVYPFKPTHESILKLLVNKDNDPRTYPLQAIGQAYDTLGTNSVAYEMIRQFYDYWVSILDFDDSSVAEMVKTLDPNARNRLFKKAGLNWRTSIFCFPRLETLLEMHKIDHIKGTHEIPTCFVNSIYGIRLTPGEEEWCSEHYYYEEDDILE